MIFGRSRRNTHGLRVVMLGTLLAAAFPCLAADHVSVEEAAKLLLIVAKAAGAEGKVACKEMDMVAQLKRQEISVDIKANIAWAFTAEQTRSYLALGKLVVCNNRKLLGEGAAIAFERVGGRLTVFVHQANLTRSGVSLPPAFLASAVKL